MIRNKCILIIMIHVVSFNFSLWGQNLAFSHEVLFSTNNDVKEISALWESYFKSHYLNNDSTIVDYWNEEEVTDGINDILKHVASPQFPIYKIGNHFVFDIRKLDDRFYEINILIEFEKDNNLKDVFAIYRVLAKKADGKFKLYNSFYYNKQRLKSYQIGKINYYYSYSYPFDEQSIWDAKESTTTLEEIQKYYGIEVNSPIIYILANSLDESNTIIGFSYSKYRSHLEYAGFSIYPPNILLACRPDHLHELIHALFRPLFPNAPIMLHEGIATYYGGSSQKDYKKHLSLLKEYLQENPKIDFSNFDSYNSLINDETNPFYTIGAVIIEHALTIGGADKVLELLQCSSMNEVFEKALNVPPIEIHQYIYNLIYENGK